MRCASPPERVPAGRSSDRYPSPISTKESNVWRRVSSNGANVGSSRPRTHSAKSLICIAQASAIEVPLIVTDRAASFRRVPSQSGHVVNVTARSTNARIWGCIASTSLDRNDFWILGISPSYVRLMLSTLTLVGSLYSRSLSSFLVYLLIGLSGSRNPDAAKMRPIQPSAV